MANKSTAKVKMNPSSFYGKMLYKSDIPPESSDEDSYDIDDSNVDRTFVTEKLTGEFKFHCQILEQMKNMDTPAREVVLRGVFICMLYV